MKKKEPTQEQLLLGLGHHLIFMHDWTEEELKEVWEGDGIPPKDDEEWQICLTDVHTDEHMSHK